jgi:hypothetical protein
VALFDVLPTDTFPESYATAPKGSTVIRSKLAAELNGRMIWESGTGFPDRLQAKMLDEEWIKTLEDGRKVKFVYQELPKDGAFITAQIAGNEVVYSIVLNKAGNPLRREDIENRFRDELSKK